MPQSTKSTKNIANDINRIYQFDMNERFSPNNDFYARYKVRNKQKYIFELIGFSSKFRPFIKNLQAVILHQQDMKNMSKLTAECLCIVLKYYLFYEIQLESQNQDKAIKYIFGYDISPQQKQQIIKIKSVIQKLDNKSIINQLDFQKRKYTMEFLQETEDNNQEKNINDLLEKDNRIIKQFLLYFINQNEYDKHFQDYSWKLKKNLMAMLPENPKGRLFFMKKIFKQLEPMFGFEITQRPFYKENERVIQIITDRYDEGNYQTKKYAKILKEYQKQYNLNKPQQLQKQPENRAMPINLQDIVFNLYYKHKIEKSQKDERQGQKIIKQQSAYLKRKLMMDIVPQLIYYYSLTKKHYPGLNPLNILYHPISDKFFLNIEPIILNALGFDLSNLPATPRQDKNNNKLEYYNSIFTNFGTFQSNIEQLRLILSYFDKGNENFIIKKKIDPCYFQFSNNILPSVQYKQQKISLFSLNYLLNCNSFGTDIHYTDSNQLWLKIKICRIIQNEIAEKMTLNKLIAEKMVLIEEYKPYFIIWGIFFQLCLVVMSKKDYEKQIAMNQIDIFYSHLYDKVNKKIRQGKKPNYKIIIQYFQLIKNYYQYLITKNYCQQTNWEITRIRCFDFQKCQEQMRSLKQHLMLCIQQKNQQVISSKLKIYIELLFQVNQNNLEWINFNVLNQIKNNKLDQASLQTLYKSIIVRQ